MNYDYDIVLDINIPREEALIAFPSNVSYFDYGITFLLPTRLIALIILSLGITNINYYDKQPPRGSLRLMSLPTEVLSLSISRTCAHAYIRLYACEYIHHSLKDAVFTPGDKITLLRRHITFKGTVIIFKMNK